MGSDHDLVMMTLRLHLKKVKKQGQMRIRFNLEKLMDPEIAEIFQKTIENRFAAINILDVDSTNIDDLIDKFNTTIFHTANEVLGKHRQIKKPWVTEHILDMCDKRRELKTKKMHDPIIANQYRTVNQAIRKNMTRAKETWIETQCKEMEDNLKMNNIKKAYQLVKDLTTSKQGRTINIQDKNGKCLTEEQDIIKRWTQYCSELYNHDAAGDNNILNVSYATNNHKDPILRTEVEAAIKSLKKGKSAGVDNVPAELILAGGETMSGVLLNICNKIWQTGEWPKLWTQSLIITIPKKGNLQLCQNYRTISLISHPSKILLKIILNRLKPQAEKIIAEEQAGFRKGRSTTEQIFNLRLLCEKYLQHQQHLYHVFVDFKKAFDRVWHDALWATMHKYNISANLIEITKNVYERATSAVVFNNTVGDWFRTTIGVRQGCLLSPILFNIFLERIMTDALEDHIGSVSIGGRIITNLRFADDIDAIAGSEEELIELVNRLDRTSTSYGMEINTEKTMIMTNNPNGIGADIRVHGQRLEEVHSFKYLGAILSDEGTKQEILARCAQTTTALSKLRNIWHDNNTSIGTKIRLMRSMVVSVLLYGCEAWTLNADLQRRIQALEMRCLRRLLGISYRDHITNEEVRKRITNAIGPFESLLSIVKTRKLSWYGHVIRSNSLQLSKTILQGTVPGGRRRGRQRRQWMDDIKDCT